MSVSTLVDPADVATVQAFEPQVRALIEAIDAAEPALRRLIEADYAGAYDVSDELRNISGEGASSGELRNVVRALEAFRNGAGLQAALDYHEFCQRDGLTVAQAARAILGVGAEADTSDEHLDRIEALRRYAATVGA
jgi:hypothetical protein